MIKAPAVELMVKAKGGAKFKNQGLRISQAPVSRLSHRTFLFTSPKAMAANKTTSGPTM